MSGVFNAAKARIYQFALNVEGNSPAGTVFRIIPYYSTATEADMLDCDTVADLEALAGVTEAAAGNWNRKSIAAAALSEQVDDANDWVDIDTDDVTWDPGPRPTRTPTSSSCCCGWPGGTGIVSIDTSQGD